MHSGFSKNVSCCECPTTSGKISEYVTLSYSFSEVLVLSGVFSILPFLRSPLIEVVQLLLNIDDCLFLHCFGKFSVSRFGSTDVTFCGNVVSSEMHSLFSRKISCCSTREFPTSSCVVLECGTLSFSFSELLLLFVFSSDVFSILSVLRSPFFEIVQLLLDILFFNSFDKFSVSRLGSSDVTFCGNIISSEMHSLFSRKIPTHELPTSLSMVSECVTLSFAFLFSELLLLFVFSSDVFSILSFLRSPFFEVVQLSLGILFFNSFGKFSVSRLGSTDVTFCGNIVSSEMYSLFSRKIPCCPSHEFPTSSCMVSECVTLSFVFSFSKLLLLFVFSSDVFLSVLRSPFFEVVKLPLNNNDSFLFLNSFRKFCVLRFKFANLGTSETLLPSAIKFEYCTFPVELHFSACDNMVLVFSFIFSISFSSLRE
ncbi:hypothetical protein C0J52_13865 [Blattella germanica]|nr:hypothetical protein C0J52_13865 [Blattella germanica]